MTSGSSRLMTLASARARRVRSVRRVDRASISAGSRRRDHVRVVTVAADVAMCALQAGAREKRLDAAALAAVAVRPRQVGWRRPRQRIVSPLTRDRVGADDRAAVDHDASASAGTEDHAEDNACACARAVDGLRQREAIGVVLEANRALQRSRRDLRAAAGQSTRWSWRS